MNILCLYWAGDFRGRDFTVDDVIRLYKSVFNHIDRPFNFYCLTNNSNAFRSINLPIIPIDLKHNWPGWWSKIEIHRPDLLTGRTLYLDLDSYIIRNLAPILDYPGDLVMFRNQKTFSLRDKRKMKRDGKIINRYQAATMLFTPGVEVMQFVYKKFCKHPESYMNQYRSDQDIMGEWIPNQPVFPSEWMIKLSVLRFIPLPEDVIVVTGQPRKDSFREPKFAPWLNEMARG